MSPDVHLALAPDSTYRSLTAADERVSAWRMLRRPLIVALVIGTAVPIMAVQRVTLGLLAASTLSFSFVVVIQLVVGVAVIASGTSRRTTVPQAVDLWFAGHLPYSVWLLTVAAAFAAMPAASLDLLIVLAVFPAAWTGVIVAAFCRHVLGTSRGGARLRATAHFLVTWAIGFELVALTAGGWFQIWAPIARAFE